MDRYNPDLEDKLKWDKTEIRITGIYTCNTSKKERYPETGVRDAKI